MTLKCRRTVGERWELVGGSPVAKKAIPLKDNGLSDSGVGGGSVSAPTVDAGCEVGRQGALEMEVLAGAGMLEAEDTGM